MEMLSRRFRCRHCLLALLQVFQILHGVRGQTYDELTALDAVEERNGKIVVQGAGASFPLKIYQDAIFAYQFQNDESVVTYQSTGSGKGKCRIMSYRDKCDNPFEGTGDDTIRPIFVDWAGSDSLLKDAEYAAYPDLQMYPAVAGAVVPIYNLGPEAAGQDLILTPMMVSQMFRKCFNASRSDCIEGSITHWNDSRIVALNPHLEPILQGMGEVIPVVRFDKSGTTEIFKKSLADFEQAFATQIGTSSKAIWNGASVLLRDLSTGVTAYVFGQPGTIGYTILAEALTSGLKVAKLQTSSGIVTASVDSVQFALIEKGIAFGNNGEDPTRLTANLHNAVGFNAWPIVGYTYFVLRKETLRPGATCRNRKATLDWLIYFYTSETVAKLGARHGFANLPFHVSAFIMNRLQDDLKCQGQIVYEREQMIDLIFRIPQGFLKVLELLRLTYTGIELQLNILLREAKADESVVDHLAMLATPGLTLSTKSALERQMAVLQGQRQNLVFTMLGITKLAAVYNLCSSENHDACLFKGTSVTLNTATIKKILTGEIVAWNDSAIMQLNPTSPLPNATIKLIRINTTEMDEWNEVIYTKLGLEPAERNYYLNQAIPTTSLDHLEVLMSDTPLSFAFIPVLMKSGPFISFANVLEGSTLHEPLNGQATCNRTITLSTLWSRTYLDDCYPYAEPTIMVLGKGFSGDFCASAGTVNNQTIGGAALMARFLDWLTSEETAKPLEDVGLIVPDRLADQQSVDSITCNGVSILNPPKPQFDPLDTLPITLGAVALVGVSVFLTAYIVERRNGGNLRRVLNFLSSRLAITMVATGFEMADIATDMLVCINLYNDTNPSVRAFFTLYAAFVVIATVVSVWGVRRRFKYMSYLLKYKLKQRTAKVQNIDKYRLARRNSTLTLNKVNWELSDVRAAISDRKVTALLLSAEDFPMLVINMFIIWTDRDFLTSDVVFFSFQLSFGLAVIKGIQVLHLKQMFRQRDNLMETVETIQGVETQNTVARKHTSIALNLIKRLRSEEEISDEEIDRELARITGDLEQENVPKEAE